MSTQICSRCLGRAANVGATNITSTPTLTVRRTWLPSTFANPFSTSAGLLALPTKAKPAGVGRQGKKVPQRGDKMTFSKKKKRQVVDRSKRPAIGERKALRKRVVLSNTNALPVQGMEEFRQEIVTDPASVGKVVGIPNDLVDRLRAVQAFKPSQGWSLFSRPAMVMRPETVEFGRIMQNTFKEKKVTRRVFVGERMTGKTVMLLQAMAMAMMRRWVVINIPDAMDLTIANTDYAPYPTSTSTPLSYTQPSYTASLLLSISRANPILQTLPLSQQAARDPKSTLPSLPSEMTLARLCQLGAETPESAWAIFQLLFSELKQPNRPPILFALDGLGFAMRETKYIDAQHYKPIHAHCFTLVSTFLEHLSGTSPLPNGGVVLAAVSESNRPNVDALNLALDQIEGNGKVARDSFKKYDERVMGVFQGPDGQERGVEVQRLGGLSKSESRALMEYWAKSGIVRGKIGVTEVAEKWGIAGGGVVGELERACFRGLGR